MACSCFSCLSPYNEAGLDAAISCVVGKDKLAVVLMLCYMTRHSTAVICACNSVTNIADEERQTVALKGQISKDSLTDLIKSEKLPPTIKHSHFLLLSFLLVTLSLTQTRSARPSHSRARSARTASPTSSRARSCPPPLSSTTRTARRSSPAALRSSCC
jgi:hypothetical protein